MTRDVLIKLLEKHHAYRADAYVDELIKRIELKEVTVEERPEANGELCIVLKVAVVQVSYTWPNSSFVMRLIELTRRIGRKKRTEFCSRKDGIGCKIRSNEKSVDAAKRLIQQKLHKQDIPVEPTGMIETERFVDSRFGFLPTIVVKFYFKAEMPPKHFKPIGYRLGRTSPTGVRKYSYFGWIPDPLYT